MALRIRKDGRIFCAALNPAEEGDLYIDDGLSYSFTVELKVFVTTECDYHMSHGGEWWLRGTEPKDVLIDKFYYE